jgi:hypothetical protein
MKKFKIIKEFPGSDALGTIVVMSNGMYNGSNNNYSSKDVENNPEFFEEVKGKDYEITQVIYANEIRTLFDGLYCLYPDGVGFELEFILNNGGKIHSVKRLSDGEFFTIGDIIDFDGLKKATLLDIEFESAPIDKGTGRLCFVNDSISLGKWWAINQLSKVKTPILTTEDGVNIYLGDRYWFIENNDNLIFNTTCIETSGNSPSTKYFSTEDAAENYLLEHKICLTLDEIKKAILVSPVSWESLLLASKEKSKLNHDKNKTK